MMSNKEAFEQWAANHTLTTIHFGWNRDQSELTLHDRTYNDACYVAKQFGWQEPRWFKPWTWLNWVITVG